jgi:DNA-binding NtrC family response regulator
MPIEKIIVLEDDPVLRTSLESQLRQRGYDVCALGTLHEAQALLARDSFDLMIVDVRLPDGQGTDLLLELQSRQHRPLVVIVSGFATVESAVECMRNGAFDYLIKPFSSDQLEVTLKKADQFTRLVRVNKFLSHDQDELNEDELLGRSPAVEQLRDLIRRVGPTQATVLIQGESGTGKELVARAMYRTSPRAEAPFIKVNCASIPENLIESEFFGHEKGAFTGALSKREGRFELAHGGTILLDEVSEISPAVQAKLLRVLQERELERVGGSRTIKVDVRVIATTNRQLEQSVARNEFREDLFFRLNVVPILVPPLRERAGDVPFLAEQFLRRFARKHGFHIETLEPDCKDILAAHSWPGNVRELQNVIERAVILCGDRGVLRVEHLGLRAKPPPPAAPGAPALPSAAAAASRDETARFPSLDELERHHILSALERCRGNRTHAARLLGISARTLRNKLHQFEGTPAAPEV